MLILNPDKRLTLEEALVHPFFDEIADKISKTYDK